MVESLQGRRFRRFLRTGCVRSVALASVTLWSWPKKKVHRRVLLPQFRRPNRQQQWLLSPHRQHNQNRQLLPSPSPIAPGPSAR